MNRKITAKTIELAAITGMRSMSGPTVVSLDEKLRSTKASNKIFGSKKVRTIVQLMAFGEIIFDKLPVTPNRTAVLPLIARTVFGAFVGANVFSSNKKSWLTGAAVGAGSAFASAQLSYEVRKVLTKQLKLPDFVVAVAEDLLVFDVSLRYLQQEDS